MEDQNVVGKLVEEGHLSAVPNNSIVCSVDSNYMMTYHSSIPPKIQFASYRASFTLLIAINGGDYQPVYTFTGSGAYAFDVPGPPAAPVTTQVDAKIGGIKDAGWSIVTTW